MKIHLPQETIEPVQTIPLVPDALSLDDKEKIEQLKLLADKGRLNGEFSNISDNVYHNHDCPADSRSTIMIARESISKFKAKKEGLIPWTTSPSKEFGKMCHSFILEPSEYEKKYCNEYQIEKPLGDARKKEENGGCKEAYQAWKKDKESYEQEMAGMTFVSKKSLEIMKGIKESMLSLDVLNDIFTADDVEFENSYFFNCPRTGILLKFRPDIIIKSKKIMLDFKTALDASPIGFGKSMANYYYDVQGAMYSTGAEVLFGGDWTFGFIVAEKELPYNIGLYALGEAERELGQEILNDTLDIIANMPPIESIKNSYSLKFKACALPAWCYTKGYR